MAENLLQTFADLAPWLLLGAAVAALLHGLLPPGLVGRQLTGPLGVLKAVGVGVPLPLCSCGVIPAAVGLRRDGASKGSVVAFLVSTPQTGVDSVLVTGSMLGLPFALYKVVSAAVTGVVGGLLAERVGGVDAPAPIEEGAACATPARGRLGRMLDHGDMVLRSIWRWIVFGVVVSAAISTYVPTGALATLGESRVLATLAVLLVSVPLYVCATASVPIAASLVAAGMPAGSALVFLMAGPATNMATLGAVYRLLGGRLLAVYLGTIVLGSVGFGLAFDAAFGTLGTAAAPGHHHHAGIEPWRWPFVGLLGLLLANFVVDDLRKWVRTMKSEAIGPEISLSVGGMHCGGCVERLEKVLRKDPRVKDVKVTLEPGRAVVRGPLTEAEVAALIEGAGYSAGRP